MASLLSSSAAPASLKPLPLALAGPRQLQEDAETFTLTARPRALPRAVALYNEPFSKAPGAQTQWVGRRDLRMGRMAGQIFYTACGTLVFRLYYRGVFSDSPAYVAEDYMTLAPGGRGLITRQCCFIPATGARAEHVLFGAYGGAAPPEGG